MYGCQISSARSGPDADADLLECSRADVQSSEILNMGSSAAAPRSRIWLHGIRLRQTPQGARGVHFDSPCTGSSLAALDGVVDDINRIAWRFCCAGGLPLSRSLACPWQPFYWSRSSACTGITASVPLSSSPSLRQAPTSARLDTNATCSIWPASLHSCSGGLGLCRLSVFYQRQRRLRRRGILSFSITQTSVIAMRCRIKMPRRRVR